jgi:NAD(P)H-hydrate repair Nnr-like enzyme with NAD(P)H-hydrate dehydratase domain
MDTRSVAYVLCRIEDDSSLTPVSGHGDILTGIAAGGYAVEVDNFDFAYALYSGDPSDESATRVASFREGRIGYRRWATKTGRISPSVEDRYDHDVDEMMA